MNPILSASLFEEVLRRLFGEQAVPPVKAPPVPPVIATVPRVVEEPELFVEVRDTEQAGMHKPQAVVLSRRQQAHTRPHAALWRDRSSVRRAFVASLIFSPPKGLET